MLAIHIGRDYRNCRASELSDCQVSGLVFPDLLSYRKYRKKEGIVRDIFKAHAPAYTVTASIAFIYNFFIRIVLDQNPVGWHIGLHHLVLWHAHELLQLLNDIAFVFVQAGCNCLVNKVAYTVTHSLLR